MMLIQEPVQAAVLSALNNYDYKDAVFLSERLLAEVGNEEALFLLATSLYRWGKLVRAHSLLEQRGCHTPKLRLLMAQCCLDLNKISEAEAAIAGNGLTKTKTSEEIMTEFGDSASYAFKILANICRKTDRHDKASDYLKRSLKINPFLWSCYEQLCELGERVDPTKVFQVANLPSFCTSSYHSNNLNQSGLLQTTTDNNSISHPEPLVTPLSTAAPTPQAPIPTFNFDTISCEKTTSAISGTPDTINQVPKKKTAAPFKSKTSMFGGMNSLSPLTPSFGVLPLDMTPSPGDLHNMSAITPPTSGLLNLHLPSNMSKASSKPRKKLCGPIPKPPVFSQCQSGNTNSATTPSPQSGSLQSSNFLPRRSSRLYSSSTGGSSVKENNKSQSQRGQKFQSPKAPAKKSRGGRVTKTPQELNELNKTESSENKPSLVNPAGSPITNSNVTTPAQVYSMQRQSADGLMTLLQDIGGAYQALNQFDCKKAVQLFSGLPPHHLNTGWVLAHLGKAFFEMANYQKAEKIFSKLHQLRASQIRRNGDLQYSVMAPTERGRPFCTS